jgi:hypothetical protein
MREWIWFSIARVEQGEGAGEGEEPSESQHLVEGPMMGMDEQAIVRIRRKAAVVKVTDGGSVTYVSNRHAGSCI